MYRTLMMLLVSFFAISVSASSSEGRAPVQGESNKGDYQPARGWHFYEIPPEVMEMIDEKIEQEVEKKLAEKLEEQKEAAPKPGSSEWIKQSMPKARQAAADDPTTENIRTLLLLEKMMHDKARRLARRAEVISQIDPVLDGSYRPTTSTLVSRNRNAEIAKNQTSLFQKLVKNEVVFWLFVDDECSLCNEWVFSLSLLTKRHGAKVLFVIPKGVTIPDPGELLSDEDANKWEFIIENGEAEKLGLKNETALFAYNGKTKEYVSVARGFVVADSIVPKVLVSADYTGWLTPEEIESTRFGVVRNDLSGASEKGFDGDMEDINSYIDFIYNKLLEEE